MQEIPRFPTGASYVQEAEALRQDKMYEASLEKIERYLGVAERQFGPIEPREITLLMGAEKSFDIYRHFVPIATDDIRGITQRMFLPAKILRAHQRWDVLCAAAVTSDEYRTRIDGSDISGVSHRRELARLIWVEAPLVGTKTNAIRRSSLEIINKAIDMTDNEVEGDLMVVLRENRKSKIGDGVEANILMDSTQKVVTKSVDNPDRSEAVIMWALEAALATNNTALAGELIRMGSTDSKKGDETSELINSARMRLIKESCRDWMVRIQSTLSPFAKTRNEVFGQLSRIASDWK